MDDDAIMDITSFLQHSPVPLRYDMGRRRGIRELWSDGEILADLPLDNLFSPSLPLFTVFLPNRCARHPLSAQ